MTSPRSVLVVGGGPAGSVTATLLAQAGLSVRLLESQHFPRYHIGESLTPSTRHVLQLAGVADALDSGDFQVKRGGTFRWGQDSWTIDWSQLFGDHIRTWQVDRAAFDALLLENAAAKGVSVRHGITAKTVAFTAEGRPSSVRCVTDDGTEVTYDGFDFLIDASGRTGLLSAQHFRNRTPHTFFRNVAIWGYWKGARLLPESPEGGVNVISSPKGWYWVIPLAGGRTSIGLVTHKDTFADARRAHPDLDALYQALVAESDTVTDLLTDAQSQGSARVETDYSYVADSFSGPGHLLIGDAACFLDPLLSTGVHLALYGGMVAAAALASVHRGEIAEGEALDFFEASYRRAYTRMLALVSSMYEAYEGKDDFFWTADRLVHEDAPVRREARDSASFGEIIAGLSDLREATEPGTRVVTGRLAAEAERVHHKAPAAPKADELSFDALRATPHDDGALNGLRVVTEPTLGLQRVNTDRP
ncbi:NAD(P)/FAD-dependent oxidoreductase [Kitasatospora purpeofusca]|uniref:NAD(P)/FAD-dependent oxidoreductase n=1 Tax=Kitasatospora purpeofusca TaxID=67352 RepID=UPI0036B83A9E